MSITRITSGIDQFNAATGKAQIAIAGIGMLVSAIRAIVDKARANGVNVRPYDEALARFEAAEAYVTAEVAEYDEIKALEIANGKDANPEA